MDNIELKLFWEQVREKLLNSLPENVHPWIYPLEPSGFDNGVLTLVTGQIMGKDLLKRKYYHQIVEIIKEVNNSQPSDVVILYDEKANKILKKDSEKLNKKIQETNLKELAMENLSCMQSASNLNLKYKFENFVVGNSNKFAYTATLAVAKNPAKKYNPLFIYGKSGLGKTHLMQALGHYTIFNNSKLKVKYTKMEDYVNDFISNSRNSKDTIENMSKFNKKYTNIDIILIDDIQFIESKTKTMSQMQHTFDTLYNKGKQIVITSDRLPKEIPTLTAALCSRFEMGLMVELTEPDFQTRFDILKRMAIDADLKYADDALKYIATHFTNNVRELEGAFNKVCAYSEMTESELSLQLVQEVLKCEEHSTTPDYGKIMSVVAKYYDVDVKDLMGTGRGQRITTARHVAMYLARQLTNNSFIEIGEFYNKKHTTVMFANDKIKQNLAINKELASDIREIKQALLVN